MNFLRSVLLVAVVCLISSCKNDLKLNAPYEEIPSVYAVLNPDDTMHIIRINKNFLGEADANVMAKVSDSINYGPGELEITLEYNLEGVTKSPVRIPKKNTRLIFVDSTVVTFPGSFNTNQRVYVARLEDTITHTFYSPGKLNTEGQYLLTIKNLHTGNIFTARANSFPAIKPTYKPMAGPPFYPYPPGTPPKEYVDYTIGSAVQEVKHPINDAVIYQLFIRMHYIDSLSFSEAHHLAIETTISSRTSREAQTVGGVRFINHSFTGNVIYSGVASELVKHTYPLIGRRMFAIEYIVYNSSQDYQDYMEYLKPSLSISQTKPLYSNFDGQKALGLFAFRNRASVIKNISTQYITGFARDPITCSYKIFDSKLTIPGCK